MKRRGTFSSNTPTLQHSNTPTLQPFNAPPLPHSDSPRTFPPNSLSTPYEDEHPRRPAPLPFHHASPRRGSTRHTGRTTTRGRALSQSDAPQGDVRQPRGEDGHEHAAG